MLQNRPLLAIQNLHRGHRAGSQVGRGLAFFFAPPSIEKQTWKQETSTNARADVEAVVLNFKKKLAKLVLLSHVRPQIRNARVSEDRHTSDRSCSCSVVKYPPLSFLFCPCWFYLARSP